MRNPFNNGAGTNMNPDMMGNINEAVSRYGGKSETELMNELAGAKEHGLLDAAQLSDVAAKLAPMLTPEQRERLSAVLRQLSQ